MNRRILFRRIMAVFVVAALGAPLALDAKPPAKKNNFQNGLEKNQDRRKHVRSVSVTKRSDGGPFVEASETEFDPRGNVKRKKNFDEEGNLVDDTTYSFFNDGRVKDAKSKRNRRGQGGPPGQNHEPPGHTIMYDYPDSNVGDVKNLTKMSSFGDTDDVLDSMIVEVQYGYDEDGDITRLYFGVPDTNLVKGPKRPGSPLTLFREVTYEYEGEGDEKTLMNSAEMLPGGKSSSMTYDYGDSIVVETRLAEDGSVLSETHTEYDDDGSVEKVVTTAQISDGSGGSSLQTISTEEHSYEYDDDDLLEKKTMLVKNFLANTEEETVTTFDAYGNECNTIRTNKLTGEILDETHYDYDYRGSAQERRCECPHTEEDPILDDGRSQIDDGGGS